MEEEEEKEKEKAMVRSAPDGSDIKRANMKNEKNFWMLTGRGGESWSELTESELIVAHLKRNKV